MNSVTFGSLSLRYAGKASPPVSIAMQPCTSRVCKVLLQCCVKASIVRLVIPRRPCRLSSFSCWHPAIIGQMPSSDSCTHHVKLTVSSLWHCANACNDKKLGLRFASQSKDPKDAAMKNNLFCGGDQAMTCACGDVTLTRQLKTWRLQTNCSLSWWGYHYAANCQTSGNGATNRSLAHAGHQKAAFSNFAAAPQLQEPLS